MTSSEQRPDTDDYDLLTFGEVAARLAEELAAETTELESIRAQNDPDEERIRGIEQRMATLKAGQQRYRRESRTGDSFTRRFGSLRGAAADRLLWQ